MWQVSNIEAAKVSNGYIIGKYVFEQEILSSGNVRKWYAESIFAISDNFYVANQSEIISNQFFDAFGKEKEIEAINIFYDITYDHSSLQPNNDKYTKKASLQVFLEFPNIGRTYEELENKTPQKSLTKSVLVATIEETDKAICKISAKEIEKALDGVDLPNNFTNFAIKVVLNNGGVRFFRNFKDKREALWTTSPTLYAVDIYYKIIEDEQRK